MEFVENNRTQLCSVWPIKSLPSTSLPCSIGCSVSTWLCEKKGSKDEGGCTKQCITDFFSLITKLDCLTIFLTKKKLVWVTEGEKSLWPGNIGININWQGMENLWSGAMFRAQVLPMACEVLPMGNSTLTSMRGKEQQLLILCIPVPVPIGNRVVRYEGFFLNVPGIYMFVCTPAYTHWLLVEENNSLKQLW